MMTQQLYAITALKKQSFFQLLLNQHPEENAVLALNNLLAGNAIEALQQEDIRKIERKYKLRLKERFPLNLEEFYAVYLNHVLTHSELGEKERLALEHLRSLLSIDSATDEKLRKLLAGDVYYTAAINAFQSGEISSGEAVRMATLRIALEMPEEAAGKIHEKAKLEVINRHIEALVSGDTFSPAAEQAFHALRARLDIAFTPDSRQSEQLRLLRHYWNIIHLPLPAVTVPVKLQKQETCFAAFRGIALGEQVATRGRQGRKWVNTGILYLTDKRILLQGPDKNSAQRLDQVSSIQMGKDDVVFEKDSGKTFVLATGGATKECFLVLRKLWQSYTPI